jgi:hypothetical protein
MKLVNRVMNSKTENVPRFDLNQTLVNWRL